MPSYVDISQPVLDWISSSVSMECFSEKSKRYLESWIKGEKKATFRQIEEVSKSTGIPFGYFFMKTAPREDTSFVEYRTIKSVNSGIPSRNLIETVQTMEIIQNWTREYLIDEGFEQLNYVGKTPTTIAVVDFAAEIRKILGIEKNWFMQISSPDRAYNYFRTAVSNICVIVMQNGIVGNNTHRSLDIHEFRAFSLIDEYAPLIFINSNDTIRAKTFSLLHELAHIFVGEKSVFNARQYEDIVSPLETLCNRTAAEILVPQSLFIEKWNAISASDDTHEIVQSLSQTFKCSESVILRRALDSKFISRLEYQEAIDEIEKAMAAKNTGKTKQSGGDYYRNLASKFDRQFLEMLITSVQSGRTSYSDAFNMTGTKLGSFQKLVAYIEGGH